MAIAMPDLRSKSVKAHYEVPIIYQMYKLKISSQE